MKTSLGLLSLSTLVALSLSGCHSADTAGTASVSSTTVTQYQPSTPSGKTVAGSCWTRSIATPRADAWRCTTGNGIQDPCFTGNHPGQVICGADPVTQNNGFVVQLTKPLPTLPAMEHAVVHPWIVKLADGSVCYPFTGTLTFIPPKTGVSYYCSDSQKCDYKQTCSNLTGLVLDSIKPGNVWQAQKVVYQYAPDHGPQVVKITPMQVVAVWQ